MSTFSVRIYKNTQSNQPPAVELPTDLPVSELMNGELIAAAQQLFQDQGVLVIRNLLPPVLIDDLQAALLAQYQPYLQDRDYDHVLKVGDKRRMLTVDLQPPFDHPLIYGNPLGLALMRGLLGPDFVLGSFGVVVALPGAASQHVHRDHPPLFETPDLSQPPPSFAITLAVPLVDLTPETGSTRVWKGSHRVAGDQALPLPDSAVPYVAKGSCYLMDYQLLHGGTPNVSNRVRPLLYITYYRSWFQEAVNYEQQSRMTMSPATYERVPAALKGLFVRQQEQWRSQPARHHWQRRRWADTAFCDLTASEQTQQLTQLAATVLPTYGFHQATIELIAHGDNTVFAVQGQRSLLPADRDRTLEVNRDRCILRIHRADYLSLPAIRSELQWLHELFHHSPLRVPEPLPTRDQAFDSTGQILGMAAPRGCSLTGWVAGRSLLDLPRAERRSPHLLTAVGRTLGRLHRHGAHWQPPAGFDRPRWDWDGLFGAHAGYSNQGDRVWSLTPAPYRQLFTTVSTEVKAVMNSLGEDAEQFGLIHGDFWLGNLLVQADDIGVIDFADCGWGYWGYDLARLLNDFADEPHYSNCLASLLQGYRQVRPFPPAQLPHLKLFLAAQQVALALWRVNRAQDHPDFQATLEADLAEAAAMIRACLAMGQPT
ncbi:MAG: phosphotransferase [Leptolyngbyaceae cyanobacterium]